MPKDKTHRLTDTTNRINLKFSKRINTIPLMLLAISLQAGCSLMTTGNKFPLFSDIEKEIHSINLKEDIDAEKQKAEQFTACMAPLTTKIRPGLIAMAKNAKDNNDEMHSRVMAKIAELDELGLDHEQSIFGRLLDHLPNAASLPLQSNEVTINTNTDLSTLAKCNTGSLTLANCNKLYFEKIREEAHKEHPETKKLIADSKQAAELSKTYLTAYFKKGVVNTAAQLIDIGELAKQLNLKIDDPQVLKAADFLNSQLKKFNIKVDSKISGFIGRDGTQYNFPGIIVQNGQVAINHNQIGADSIRIVLEAFRDTFAPLPILPESTAAAKNKNGSDSKLKDFIIDLDPVTKKQFSWHYDHHDPSQIIQVSLNEEDFQDIESRARKAEAKVAGIVGKAIRGGSWGSLNNEAIATMIETATGVVARHVVERAGLCVQAQESHAPQTSEQ